jgi:hypothetical protein
VSGAAWGQAAGVRLWHRLGSPSHGDQFVLCGLNLVVTHVYHCDPKAGDDASPVVGSTCKVCVARSRSGE